MISSANQSWECGVAVDVEREIVKDGSGEPEGSESGIERDFLRFQVSIAYPTCLITVQVHTPS